MRAVVDPQTKEVKYLEDDLQIAQNPRAEIEKAINDAIEFLSRTDHKELPSYEPTPDENIEQIIAERVAKRRFIRENRNA